MENNINPPSAADERPNGVDRRQQELEEQLRQVQRQSLLGQMAGGVSHDLNNLLTVILGHTDLLHEGMSPEELLSHKQAIRKAAQQGCAISGQLLTFSRKQTPTPKVLDLNTVVAELQNMLRRCLGEQIPLL